MTNLPIRQVREPRVILNLRDDSFLYQTVTNLTTQTKSNVALPRRGGG
jgi:hypothetical protein